MYMQRQVTPWSRILLHLNAKKVKSMSGVLLIAVREDPFFLRKALQQGSHLQSIK